MSLTQDRSEATDRQQADRRDELDQRTDGERKMSDANRRFFLRIALVVFGLTFIFGIYGGVSSGRPAGLGGKDTRTIS